MNTGKTLFAQVMEFVPRKTFSRILARHHGESGTRTLPSTDLFRILNFSQLTRRESLRDIEACLAANESKLFHRGLRTAPARSTLADALNKRDWRIYQTLASELHTLLDLRGAIPSFIHISNGKMHDVRVLDMLPVEAGSIYVMDRGYIDYKRLFALHQAGVFFVTRAKESMDARRVYSTPTDRAIGIVCDQTRAA